MKINTIINDLMSERIDIYEAINKIRQLQYSVVGDLIILLENKESYKRLFAAWALGELKAKNSFNRLISLFIKEKDPNVRANITRSLYFINPNSIDLILFNKFLKDKYYPIPLMAIKFISLSNKVQRRISFNNFYKNLSNQIIKIEALRNIHFFKTNKYTVNLLKEELLKKDKITLAETIKAIGLLNSPRSLDILLGFYNKESKKLFNDLFIVDSLISSLIFLCQSKAYSILEYIYFKNQDFYLHKKIIEALITAGGPKSLEILNRISKEEKDKILSKMVLTEMKKIKIIDNKRINE